MTAPARHLQARNCDVGGTNTQTEDSLDLRGDLANPRRLGASELYKLPRVEARTTDPHDPDKEVVYSGTLHGGRA